MAKIFENAPAKKKTSTRLNVRKTAKELMDGCEER